MYSPVKFMNKTGLTAPTLAFVLVSAMCARQSAAQGLEILWRAPFQHAETEGVLVQAPDGSFYGTSPMGGSFGRGSIFVLAPDGFGGFTRAEVYSFSGPDGREPAQGVAFGTDGRLYGTTRYGGASDLGTFFRLDLNGRLTQLAAVGPAVERPRRA